MELPSVSPIAPGAQGPASFSPMEANKLAELNKLYRSEMTEISAGRLDTSFLVSTHKDEATRLISRFSSTVDTLNQILQKV